MTRMNNTTANNNNNNNKTVNVRNNNFNNSKEPYKNGHLNNSNNANNNGKMSNTSNVTSSKIYQILSRKERNLSSLFELNDVLHNEINNTASLNFVDNSIEGSYLHYLAQTAQSTEDISWRMVYSFANAGMDVNLQNSKGNTALHVAYTRGYTEVGFNFIEALLKVGTDLEIKNKMNKIAYNYMEAIEQLNCMYIAHSPSIWQAVENSAKDDIIRLINSWVKVTSCKNGMTLLSLAMDVCGQKNTEILTILESSKLQNDFVHAIYAMDLRRMDKLKAEMSANTFNPNMADFCYCYSWFRPICRNLPRFLLETALETRQEFIIEILLNSGADANLLHSKSGNPFFFYAYEPEFSNLKAQFLKNANFYMKNYRAQNILFHLVHTYASQLDSTKHKHLLDEFYSILVKHPMLITHRDQDDVTLVEAILTMPPIMYRKATDFLIEISKFSIELIHGENLSMFQEYYFNAYGLVLLNTPIYLEPRQVSSQGGEFQSSEFYVITLEKFLLEMNNKLARSTLKSFVEFDFVHLVGEFLKAVKVGDLDNLKLIMAADKRKCLTRYKDYSHRTCLHMAVLYSQATISKYLLTVDPSLVNSTDNLGRTALHYAYALRDNKIIQILNSFNINERVRDVKFLVAEDFLNDEVQNDISFMMKNFKENEIKKFTGAQMYLKCFEYKKIKLAIEKNDAVELARINLGLKNLGFSLKDVPFWRSDNCFEEGKPYIPPLEYAMEKRSFSAFRFILENTVESKRVIQSAGGMKLKSAQVNNGGRVRSAHSSMKSIDFNLCSLRERAEEEEIEEIIDILDNFGDDKEISAATHAELLSATAFHTAEITSHIKRIDFRKPKVKETLPILANLIKEKNYSAGNMIANNNNQTSNEKKFEEKKFLSKSWNNFSSSSSSSANLNSNRSKSEPSKLCAIL